MKKNKNMDAVKKDIDNLNNKNIEILIEKINFMKKRKKKLIN